jgi:membrane protein implicated in regulation of membrane protease activity
LTNIVISMEYGFIGFYLVVFILAGMISYAGTENTLNLVRYVDLSIRYQIVLVRTFFMRRKLKRVLNKSMKELQNDRKNSI